MRFGSVCSGIEAASVAWHQYGWWAAWLAEVDSAATAVLAYRFPGVPNLGDMTAIAGLIDAGVVEAPDLLVGGTPCQGFSVAGRRGGLSDPRGQLTLSFVEIVDAIDRVRADAGEPPCIAVWENVPGVLSMGDNAFGNFLAALAGEDVPLEPTGKRWPDAGVVIGPERTIAWVVKDAQYFGLAQRRKRVFVVASARDGFDPGEILLEFDGMRRDSPPSRQTGEGIAGTLDARTDGGGFPGTDGACSGHDVPAGVRLTNRLIWPAEIASTLNAHFGGKQGLEDQHALGGASLFVPAAREVQCVTGSVTHTLKAEGFDASEDGTGRGQPIVPQVYRTSGNCGAWSTGDRTDALTTSTDPFNHVVAFSAKDHGADATSDLSPTLRAGGHSDSHANGGVMPAVCYGLTTEQTPKYNVDCALTLTKQSPTGGGQIQSVAYAIQERAICENPLAGPDGVGVRSDDCAYTLEARTVPHDVEPFTLAIRGRDGAPNLEVRQDGTANALLTPNGGRAGIGVGAISTQMAVRRLLPVECERLQGFPDNWTRIPARHYPSRTITKLRPEDMWEPDPNGGWWLMAADGPRYKQLGNSMAVNVMAWIGGRIKDWLELEPFRELIG